MVDLIEDENGDLILPIPDEICKDMNVGPGTELSFVPQPDGSIIMKRKNELKTYAVETISMFRMVYFVKAESLEHAMDEITCEMETGMLNPVQSHVTENITHGYEIDNAGIVRVLQQTEQPSMTLEKLESGPWLNNLVHTIDYSK